MYSKYPLAEKQPGTLVTLSLDSHLARLRYKVSIPCRMSLDHFRRFAHRQAIEILPVMHPSFGAWSPTYVVGVPGIFNQVILL